MTRDPQATASQPNFVKEGNAMTGPAPPRGTTSTLPPPSANGGGRPPRSPEAPGRPTQRNRISGISAALIVGVAALVVVLIFIIQNVHSANISFLGVHLVLPLAAALILAAIAGALAMAAVGTARIAQLRQIIRRDRRNTGLASRRGRLPYGLRLTRADPPARPATTPPRTRLTKEPVMSITTRIVPGRPADQPASKLAPR
jgi:putative membrane protein